MDKHSTAKAIVTNILERHPETRAEPLEVLRRVYHDLAYKPQISSFQIDNAIDTIQKFKAAGVNMETILRATRHVQHKERPDLDSPAAAAERDRLAEEYRTHYSPKDDTPDDPNQTRLF